MKNEVIRLVFGCSLTLAAGLAMAQNHTTGQTSGGSGGSGSHSTGGGGPAGGGGQVNNGGGMRSSGNTGNSGNGSYSSHNNGSQGSAGSRYSGGSSSSRYGGSSNYSSRHQSRNGGETGSSSTGGNTQNRSSSYSQNRNGATSQNRSGGYSNYRQGGSYSSSGAVRSSGYSGRSGTTGPRNVVAQNGFDHGHANLSRSGQVNYTGSNNHYGSQGINSTERMGAPRHGLIDQNALGRVIGSERGGMFRGGWRSGYFGYWGGWRDSFFAFPFYVFDPWFGPCYCSPWYYYPCLPAYIAAPRVIIVDSYPSTNFQGDDYDWAPGDTGSKNVVLDDSVQDIIQAFEADDHTALDRAVPHSGNVNIYTDGKYAYTLKANDFYDTYVDGIESTKTDRYEITDVKASKDGATARVTAKHVYNDPWGNRTYVYHSYFLVKEGDEYVIREFGTSDNTAE